MKQIKTQFFYSKTIFKTGKLFFLNIFLLQKNYWKYTKILSRQFKLLFYQY